MYGFLFNNQTVANTAYQLLLLGTKIEESDSVVNDVIDIRHLFPRWIMDRNSEGNIVKRYLQLQFKIIQQSKL